MNHSDPHLWLEEVEGEKGPKLGQNQNKSSLTHFEADPRYNQYLSSAEDLLNAKDRIPYGAVRGGVIYNFWQDETNVRGLWRKTTPESYRTDDPSMGNHPRLSISWRRTKTRTGSTKEVSA